MGKGFPMGVGGGADTDVVTAKAKDVLSGKVIVGPDGEPMTGSMANRGNISHTLPINGSYIVPQGYHAGSGAVRQSVATKGAQTFTPGRSNQTIGASQWLTGAQTIMGDPNLVAGNIREGVTIFGTRGNVVEYKTPSNPIVRYDGVITAKDGAQGNDAYWYGNNIQCELYGALRESMLVIGRCNTALNLTGWNYLNFYMSSGRYASEFYVGVSQNAMLGSISFVSSYKLGALSNMTVKLNVASLSGVYYLYLAMRHTWWTADIGREVVLLVTNVSLSSQ